MTLHWRKQHYSGIQNADGLFEAPSVPFTTPDWTWRDVVHAGADSMVTEPVALRNSPAFMIRGPPCPANSAPFGKHAPGGP